MVLHRSLRATADGRLGVYLPALIERYALVGLRANQVQRLWVYALASGESIPSVETTAEHVARLISERYDPKDVAPWNYDWYAVVESPDGRLFQWQLLLRPRNR